MIQGPIKNIFVPYLKKALVSLPSYDPHYTKVQQGIFNFEQQVQEYSWSSIAKHITSDLKTYAHYLYNPFRKSDNIERPQSAGDIVNTLDVIYKPTFSLIKPVAIAGIAAAGIAVAAYQFYHSKNAVKKALLEKEILEYVYAKTHSVAVYIKSIHALSALIESTPELMALKELHPIIALSTTTDPKIVKLMHLLHSAHSDTAPSTLPLAPGNVLAAFKLMHEIKDLLIPSLQAVGLLDVYASSAKLINSTAHQPVSYCFAEYISNAASPYVLAQDFWNPFLAPDQAVPNSLEFGTPVNPNNAILTGPNTAGKTTTIKGILVNILMAQSLGIAPAQSLLITPFSVLNCYVNITDSLSEGVSLFKAEVLRAKDLLKAIESLAPHHFSFTLMDEIFSGTSPQEGEHTAYLFAEKLGKFPNSLTILATHYPKLTTLAAGTVNSLQGFKNYAIAVVRTPQGTLHRPFKIQEGCSEHNIALDLLQQEGVL